MISDNDKIKALLRLPWSLQIAKNADDGGLVARVAELPSVLATGDTEEELAEDLWAALRATFAGYLHFGDTIPLPAGITAMPWEQAPRKTIQPMDYVSGTLRGAAWTPREGPPEAVSIGSAVARRSAEIGVDPRSEGESGYVWMRRLSA
jgi:predicted RNase H-like HicB family nuclease